MCLIIALICHVHKEEVGDMGKLLRAYFDCSNCCMELVPHPSFFYFILVGDRRVQDFEAPEWREVSRYYSFASILSVVPSYDNNYELI